MRLMGVFIAAIFVCIQFQVRAQNSAKAFNEILEASDNPLFSIEQLPFSNLRNIECMIAGDYDNDGDLDIALSAQDDTDNYIIKILRNDSDTDNIHFYDIGLDIQGLKSEESMELSWYDVDQDGLLDLVVSDEFDYWKTSLYRNLGNDAFSSSPIFLSTDSFGTGVWIDYDKDGDLDFYGNGLFENKGVDTFSKISNELSNRGNGLATDYDNDGDYDIIEKNFIYTNFQNNFERTNELQTAKHARKYFDFDIDWDGDLDFVLFSIGDEMWSPGDLIHIMLNEGTIFKNFDIENLEEGSSINVLVNDYDNNGRVDILNFMLRQADDHFYKISELLGDTSAIKVTHLNQFFKGDYQMKANVNGDFDSDGDVDLLIASIQNGVNVLEYWDNTTSNISSAPSPPSLLSSNVLYDEVTLKWKPGSDDHIPDSSLFHNLYIRAGMDTIKPSLSLRSGKNKLTQKGNVLLNKEYHIKGLPNGTYSWAVQSIDYNGLSSSFSIEDTFQITSGADLTGSIINAEKPKSIYINSSNEYLLIYLKENNLFGQYLDANDGQKIKNEFQLNINSIVEKDHFLAYDNLSNTIFVTWIGDEGQDENSVFLQCFKPGKELKPELNVGKISPLNDNNCANPKIIFDTKGRNYLLLWIEGQTVWTNEFEFNYLRKANISFQDSEISVQDIRTLVSSSYGIDFEEAWIKDFAIEYIDHLDKFLVTWANNNIPDLFFLSIRHKNKGKLLFGFLPNAPGMELEFPSKNFSIDFLYIDNPKLQYHRHTRKAVILYQKHDPVPAIDYCCDISQAIYQDIFSITKDSLISEINKLNLSIDFPQWVGGSKNPVIAINTQREEFLAFWEGEIYPTELNFNIYSPIESEWSFSEEQFTKTIGLDPSLAFHNSMNRFLLSYSVGSGSTLRGINYSFFEFNKDLPPIVNSISASEGYVNDTVTVYGENFGKLSTLNEVYFKDAKAEVIYEITDGSNVKVLVPTGLTRDPVPIFVTFDEQTGESDFNFEAITKPEVSGFWPRTVERSDILTIYGDRFSDSFLDMDIYIEDIKVSYKDTIQAKEDAIRITIPENIPRGTYGVSVTIQGQMDAADSKLRVIVPPVIEEVTIDNATSCELATIKGANFSDKVEDLEVSFGNITVPPEDFVSTTSTAIICKIPIGVTETDFIIVRTDDREAMIASDFEFHLGAEIESRRDIDVIEHVPGVTNKITLGLSVFSDCSASTPVFNYRGITSQGAWEKETMVNTGAKNSYGIELSDDYFTDPVGIDYFYSVEDLSDTVIYSEDTAQVLRKYLGIDSLNNISNFVEYFGENVADYRLVSVPFTFKNNKVREVFADLYLLYGADSVKWRIFEYDAESQRFLDVMDGESLVEPGKCFALLARNKVDLNLVEGTTVEAKKEGFKIVLKPGWNLVGNPYPFDILWSEVLSWNGDPVELSTPKGMEETGWFDDPRYLKKFSGLAVDNKSGQDFSLYIPCKPSYGSRRLAAENLDGYLWKVSMTLQGKSYSNNNIEIGMHKNAVNGLDYRDERQVPRFVNYLELNSNNLLLSDRYSKDITSPDWNHEWEYKLEQDLRDEHFSLSWEAYKLDRNLWLFDQSRNELVDMKSQRSYTFTGSKDFQFIYGDMEYLKEQVRPAQNSIGQLYPNPVLTSASVPLYLIEGESSRSVDIRISDLSGKLRKTIQKQVDAGLSILELDIAELPKGFYVVTAEIDQQRFSQKLVKE